MDWLALTFPVSGVHTWLWLPPLVAFTISFFTSMVGISGAFLLLPFQMSILSYTAPSVSATNLVYNLVATPGGVYRYLREGRMVWPLVWVIVVGTLPGIVIGYFLRVRYLPDPRDFKLFAGLVLLYIGYRVLAEFLPWHEKPRTETTTPQPVTAIRMLQFSLARTSFSFGEQTYSFSVPAMFLLALVVGVIGGIYGIGGGAIIAPFCVALFGLPVHAIAGAAIAGTLFTSVAGVALYSLLPAPVGMATQPDWALGLLFGLGGFAGMYFGARCQKRVPQKTLKLLLGLLLMILAGYYIFTFFA
ncbi:MAG: sulfite exporter TauE/SafE family protein [Gammaproteobacteria bacterium]|nr:sulfite exporter TauE/SafE family protein [Gammaproteobacteria bacterium]MBU1977852.1 sulfite exporter TauE/SafE family protein [Gammaproteobacteria bacterium]